MPGAAGLACLALLLLAPQFGLRAQTAAFSGSVAGFEGDVRQAQAEIARARAEGAEARQRAEGLEAKARTASEEAEKTAREAAAVAARIQETQAAIAEVNGNVRRIELQRDRLRARMAERQAPLARLTGALQRLSRRPVLLALLRPGSVRDAVYMRALLDTMLPVVQQRTASLRREIARGQDLERKAQTAQADLRKVEDQFIQRRQQLAGIEARQRLASREASGVAAREAEHALALSEKAGDLTGLLGAIGEQGALRESLANLPGPIMRPVDPARAQVPQAEDFAAPPNGLGDYVLPVVGRLITGFGERTERQSSAAGLTFETRAQAQIVAPAGGRVAFAGPYRGYGRIVIIEHDGGWVSLVTGLARLDTAVGQTVVSGSPIGLAGPGKPIVQVELRHDGQSVNPLQYLGAV